jgi:hypothetical protein
MLSTRTAALIALLLFFEPSSANREQLQEEPVPEEVPYCQLAENPSAFVGKHVRIRAIYISGYHEELLEPPSCCAEPKELIWTKFQYTLDAGSERLLRSFPNAGYVLGVFHGKLESGGPFGQGDINLQFAIDRIEKVEKKSTGLEFPGWFGGCRYDPISPPRRIRSARCLYLWRCGGWRR